MCLYYMPMGSNHERWSGNYGLRTRFPVRCVGGLYDCTATIVL